MTTPTSIQWIPLKGWFSDICHDNTCWLGIDDGHIVAMLPEKPGGGCSVGGSTDADQEIRATGSVLRMEADREIRATGSVLRMEADREIRTTGRELPLYALPLLSDTHVHVYMEPWPVEPALRGKPGGQNFETEVENAIERVDAALASGVGLLRDMGDPHGINVEVKRRLLARGKPAPELLVPGPGFHRPKKYGRFLGVMRESVEEIIYSIDELHSEGMIDYVKLVTTGIVDFAERRVKQTPQFTADELIRVVDFTHSLGCKVASHCSGEEGIDINIAAGVDFIEHAYFVRPDQLKQMAAKKLHWTPTFAPVYAQGYHAECGWTDNVRASIQAILEQHGSSVYEAWKSGVRVLAGTDAGSPGVSMGSGIRIELECMAAAGIPADELLRIVTTGNAEYLNAQEYVPRIGVGLPATFALYEKCPWQDISNLQTLKEVFYKGVRICNPHKSKVSGKYADYKSAPLLISKQD